MIVEKSDTFSFAKSAAKLLFREPTGDCYEIVPLGGGGNIESNYCHINRTTRRRVAVFA